MLWFSLKNYLQNPHFWNVKFHKLAFPSFVGLMLKKDILTNVFPTGLAVLRIQRFKTVTAERSPILHDVSLSTQDCFTLEATEVLHVPVATLSFCTLIGKNDLFRDTK